MNAILLFLGYVGFACLPPPSADLSHIVDAGYSGPWTMTEAQAQDLAATGPDRGVPSDRYEIIRGDDPAFEAIMARCPPIY
jgi:hypothetical protein